MKIAISLMLILCNLISYAQSPDWAWAKSANGIGIGSQDGKGVCADASGNVYVTGAYSTATIAFGTITLTNTNAGDLDFYLLKYDASGNVLWAKNMGGKSSESSESVTTDNFGNVYLTGSFFSDTLILGTTHLVNHGPSVGYLHAQEFLAKFDASGNVLWAKTTSETYDTEGGGTYLTTDAEGSVYETGYFWAPTIVFGTYTLINTDPSGLTNDVFIAKYEPAGNVLWAKSAGGALRDIPYCVSADACGNVYIAGKFESTIITFGPYTLTNANPSAHSDDIFIAKYAADGSELWAKRMGGTNIDIGKSVFCDVACNVYLTGYFFSPSVTFGTTTLTNSDSFYSDLFLAKFDPTGDVLWAKGAIGKGSGGQSVSMDAVGNVYVVGYFSDTFTIGANTFTTSYNVNGIGNYHVFVAQYDSSGNVTWAKSAGGACNDLVNCSAANASGNVYITGHFSSPNLSFGSSTLTNTNAGLGGAMFVAKLDHPDIAGINSDQLFTDGIVGYPNPVDGYFIIDLAIGENATICVYDLTGRMVIQPFVASGRTALNTMSLLEGTYIVSVTDCYTMKNKKIKILKSK